MRKSLKGLSAILPILLALGSVTVHAAQAPAAPARIHKQGHHHHPAAKAAHKPARKVSRKVSHSRRKARRHIVPAIPSNGMRLGLRNTDDDLALKSSAAFVVDQDTGETVAVKNPDVVLPIASLTKLMTALVVLDSGLAMDDALEIGAEDVDTEKKTRSRLKVGTRLSRAEMLLLALMSSENRAAMSLSRHYPGGRAAFVAQMNKKAQALGMASSHFADPAGLSQKSVSTARDLHRLVKAAYAQPVIRSYTTQAQSTVRVNGRTLTFINSNRLVRKAGDWDIELQKTGFTNEAGRCLIMQATVLSRRLAMIFLDSTGALTRYADAARVRKRVERELKAAQRHPKSPVAATAAAS
ncbi:MAG TPA: serine hydrolase [Candidatus Binatia bacterium]|nr:serine hydrolase [Candidatus Binatia bacterium]